MAVVDSLQDLLEDLGGIRLFEVLLGDDPIEQLTAATELCDEVDVLRVFEVLVELKDVRVVERLQDFYLLLKTLPILNLFPGDGLASPLLPTDLMGDFSDDTVGARAKGLLLDIV